MRRPVAPAPVSSALSGALDLFSGAAAFGGDVDASSPSAALARAVDGVVNALPDLSFMLSPVVVVPMTGATVTAVSSPFGSVMSATSASPQAPAPVLAPSTGSAAGQETPTLAPAQRPLSSPAAASVEASVPEPTLPQGSAHASDAFDDDDDEFGDFS